MQNVDELCIKYVMNELDPSERIMVEKAMREDENVLIEIESLRCTLKKLDQLPEVAPPEALRQQVLNKASQHIEAKRRKWPMFLGMGSLAAAAITVVVFGLGLFNEPSEVPELQTSNNTQQADLMQAGSITQEVENEPKSEKVNKETTESDNSVTEPWVDRQKVLRIQISQGPDGKLILGSDADASAQAGALRPVETNQSTTSYPVMRDIQLTRTRQ